MRSKKVEGEYQTDFWPKGPERSLCPLARPDIAMGSESQIEAWSACRSRCLETPGSHSRIASIVERTTPVSKSKMTGRSLRGDHSADGPWGLGCQGQRHRGGESFTLDIPLHRRNLWDGHAGGRFLNPTDPSARPLGPSVGMTPLVRSARRRRVPLRV